eukprot:sb/3478168/
MKIPRDSSRELKLSQSYYILSKLCDCDYLATTNLHVQSLEGPVRSLPVAVGYQGTVALYLIRLQRSERSKLEEVFGLQVHSGTTDFAEIRSKIFTSFDAMSI